MALQGGKIPFDPAEALAGPARTVYAPITEDVPDVWEDIFPFENTAGEYPLSTGWIDFGLAADAPTYNHSRETEGLEYQQPAGVLFEQLSEVSRVFTAQIAGIDAEQIKIVENSSAAIESIAAAAGKSAVKKLPFGSYSSLTPYRIAMLAFRPDGSTVVEESDNTIRPAGVALVLPRVVLGAEDSEFSFGAQEPVNAPIAFNVIADPELDSGEEMGFWLFEQEGTIA